MTARPQHHDSDRPVGAGQEAHGTVMRWFGAALAATLVEAIVGYLRRP
jgi:hypothetical protein